MATNPTTHYGAHDFKLGELRNFRVHIFPTVALMNAVVSTAEARICYVIETSRFYFGQPGSWIPLGPSSSFEDPVATPGDLPTDPSIPVGQVRVVLADPAIGGLPNLFVYDGGGIWVRITDDPRLVFVDGTRVFTGIPAVSNPVTVVPTLDQHLTTKKYVDDELDGLHTTITGETGTAIGNAMSAHIAALDPHTQYLFITTFTAHVNDIGDPHAAALYAKQAALTAHINDPGDPHAAADYATTSEATIIGNAQAVIVVSAHNVAGSAHLGQGWQTAADVAASINVHDTDPAAHGGIIDKLDALLLDEHVGVGTLIEDMVAVQESLVFGRPLTVDGASDVYLAASKGSTVAGLLLRSSTITSLGADTVTFDAVNSRILFTVIDPTVLQAGLALKFTGSVNNNGRYYLVRRIDPGGYAIVDPKPIAEGPVAVTVQRLEKNGAVALGGLINIPENRIKVNAATITDIIYNRNDDGTSLVDLTGYNLSAVVENDIVTIVGNAEGNNGDFYVKQTSGVNVILKSVPKIIVGPLNIAIASESDSSFQFSGAPDLSLVNSGYILRVTGSVGQANDRDFTISAVDNGTKTITVLEAVVDDVTGLSSGDAINPTAYQLPVEADGGGGTATIHTASAPHDFMTTDFDVNPIVPPTSFFFDDSATNKYSTQPIRWKLGRQISRYLFFVNIGMYNPIRVGTALTILTAVAATRKITFTTPISNVEPGYILWVTGSTGGLNDGYFIIESVGANFVVVREAVVTDATGTGNIDTP